MEGLQLLTEKDLPYFKRMVEEGRAVIIELSIEQLLAMDPGEWLQENGMVYSEKKLDEESDKENKILKDSFKTLAEYLEGAKLTEVQYERVQRMITEGFTEEQIIKLLILEKA